MRHLSLFNGIGGFMLAAHFVGWENVAYVERELWLNELTKKNFPNAKTYRFIEEFDPMPFKGTIDIISGSDPCQPHSYAGLGRGTNDNRYLWPEMFRCIQSIHPAWIINENVVGTVSNGVLDIKISDLESEGYTCQAYNIPAEAVGALHKRERIWLIAYDSNCKIDNRTAGKYDKKKTKKILSEWNKIQHTWIPVNLWNGASNSYKKRWEDKYNANIPIILSEKISRYFGFGDSPHGDIPAHIIESGIVGMLNGLPEGMDYNNRYKRCQAIGNSIVWQIAYEIFKCIDVINNNINIYVTHH
ncbi:MAG: DNA cytosine methyltransferase [Chitinophagaceae bacterium]|nr:MAG: DNA cytosine methyltransferase [Chitinophagaceae bacterium]